MMLKDLLSKLNDNLLEEVAKIEYEEADLIAIEFTKNLHTTFGTYTGYAIVRFIIADEEDYSVILTEYDEDDEILDEVDKRLRTISEEVKFPLSEEDKNTINDIIDYLTNSQIEEIAEKYDLRPGMGLAAIQLGINKRYFVVVHEQEIKETFKNYVIINPKIVSNSEEMIYVEEGEGCLSINRECEGIVPRYARVTVEGYDVDGNKITWLKKGRINEYELRR